MERVLSSTISTLTLRLVPSATKLADLVGGPPLEVEGFRRPASTGVAGRAYASARSSETRRWVQMRTNLENALKDLVARVPPGFRMSFKRLLNSPSRYSRLTMVLLDAKWERLIRCGDWPALDDCCPPPAGCTWFVGLCVCGRTALDIHASRLAFQSVGLCSLVGTKSDMLMNTESGDCTTSCLGSPPVTKQPLRQRGYLACVAIMPCSDAWGLLWLLSSCRFRSALPISATVASTCRTSSLHRQLSEGPRMSLNDSRSRLRSAMPSLSLNSRLDPMSRYIGLLMAASSSSRFTITVCLHSHATSAGHPTMRTTTFRGSYSAPLSAAVDCRMARKGSWDGIGSPTFPVCV
mmetsp:Transcript_27513/g.60103  ORF Transcript_27513/g.60103 Transcript_27513/m.60103 type:complete len:350 (-) Transcript_27513:1420-2469(-)